MRFGILAFWGLLMIVLAGLYAWRMYERPLSSAPAEHAPAAAQNPVLGRPVRYFSLTERNGTMATSDDLNGDVWVASFFFSNCPGVCLKLNETIAELQKEFPQDDVRFVSISVDPENDTPERLTEYAQRFGADPDRWWFLTGPMNKIKDIAERSFQVSAEKAVHSDRLILVDRQGRVRGSFRGSEPAQVTALRQKIVEVAKEPS